MTRIFIFVGMLMAWTTSVGGAMEKEDVRLFHDSVRLGDIVTVRTMVTEEPLLATSVDEYRFQPVHLLDMYFEPEILDLLLAHGADINARNDEGVTLLHLVAEPGAVSVLVGKGADLEAVDVRGWTPLLMQANEQRNDVVMQLLHVGADPNASGGSGETALSFAEISRNDELISMLRAAGARK